MFLSHSSLAGISPRKAWPWPEHGAGFQSPALHLSSAFGMCLHAALEYNVDSYRGLIASHEPVLTSSAASRPAGFPTPGPRPSRGSSIRHAPSHLSMRPAALITAFSTLSYQPVSPRRSLPTSKSGSSLSPTQTPFLIGPHLSFPVSCYLNCFDFIVCLPLEYEPSEERGIVSLASLRNSTRFMAALRFPSVVV